MPRRRRSQMGWGEGPPPPPSPQEVQDLTQDPRMSRARHLRSPVSGLWVRVDLLEAAPFPLEARTQFYGAREIVWTEPEAPTEEEIELMRRKLQEALAEEPPEPGVPPPPRPPRPRPAPQREPAQEIPPFTPAERPSERAVRALVQHLEAVGRLDPTREEVAEEIDRLALVLADWEVEVDFDLEQEEGRPRTDPTRVQRLRRRSEVLSAAQAAAEQGDLAAAVEALRRF